MGVDDIDILDQSKVREMTARGGKEKGRGEGGEGGERGERD
jgi:hypothetical protein